jgi:acetylcholinesterase
MKDVIVVTINYRFSAFGFACIPSKGINGNATLKDQQMALEWIHENISNFGGDPDNICLFGESAGSACVNLHLYNEKSKKFIKSAIMQSNTIFADWLIQKDPIRKTKELGLFLGAKSDSDDDIYNALMSSSTRKIYENDTKTIQDKDYLRRNLPFVFKPSIEEESDDAFLTKTPLKLIKTQNIDAKIIIGLNGDGMTMVNSFRHKQLPNYNSDFVKLVPISLNIDPNSEEAIAVGKRIKEFYFQDKPIDSSTLPQFITFMTDFHFTIPQTITYELHSMYQKHEQFLYEFCYDGELNGFKSLLQMDQFSGACHFDELFYLFEPKILRLEAAKNSKAWKMREAMCNMWTNFAKVQNPTPKTGNVLPFEWTPAKRSNERSEKIDIDYLQIGNEIKMSSNIYEERIDFWRQIYKQFNGSFHNPKF